MFYIGLDLGQRCDPSAIAVVEQREPLYRGMQIRYLERIALGTPYVRVAERMRRMVEHRLIAGDCHLTVDATGVGAPVVEMLRDGRLRCGLTAVTITGGAKAHGHGVEVHVPKQDLLGGLQVLLEKGELKIARRLRERGSLVKELQSMRLKGNSEGGHDDLAMAAALACWSAGRPRNGFRGQRLPRI